jgi:hypothetical protein
MRIAQQQKSNVILKDWYTQTTAVPNISQMTEHVKENY